jgi:hypothetical protein
MRGSTVLSLPLQLVFPAWGSVGVHSTRTNHPIYLGFKFPLKQSIFVLIFPNFFAISFAFLVFLN